MLPEKMWVYKDIASDKVNSLSREAGVSTLLAKVLLSRGMDNIHAVQEFLNPSMNDLHDPYLLKDMDKAVERITTALSNHEKITIYGDYDVDGVTSTSILYNFLSGQGSQVDFYIPDRMEEGYGISKTGIDRILATGTTLIITVDCGITAFDEVQYCCLNHMDIIITDHHECKEGLPEAIAVVNPHRPDCTYPFKELAGVGVTFKLISALCIKLGLKGAEKQYLDLVAVGTVADVVSLVNENRIIVKYGLEQLKNTSNTGLKALIDHSGLGDKPINSWSIGFVIAPRINAAGRIGDARRGVRLFITKDEKEALATVLELNEENKFRQDTEQAILKEVVNIIETEIDLDKEKVIVAAGEGWHHGVIGIVASKITDRYYRPCILLSTEDGLVAKGSGRSIEGFNLFKALSDCEALLEKFGGHELAAGLSLKTENIPVFREGINAFADLVLTESDLVPKVRIDVKLGVEDIHIDYVKELEKLAPFGAGNPSPVFAYDSLKINSIRTVGDNKHLKLNLANSGYYLDAIGFNMGGLADIYAPDDLLDVACSLEINTWNASEKVQMNLKDVRPIDEVVRKNQFFYSLDKSIEFKDVNGYNRDNGLLKEVNQQVLEELIPERRDLAAVYQYMKAKGDEVQQIDNLFLLAKRITDSYKVPMNYFKLKKILEIFHELNLMNTKNIGKYGMQVRVLDTSKQKAALETSPVYRSLQAMKSLRSIG